jgi:hypothetical protein
VAGAAFFFGEFERRRRKGSRRAEGSTVRDSRGFDMRGRKRVEKDVGFWSAFFSVLPKMQLCEAGEKQRDLGLQLEKGVGDL